MTKPILPPEVLARIAAHTQTARVQRQARNALDAFGHATMVVRPLDGRLLWQTALARALLRDDFGSEGSAAPVPLIDWVRREAAARAAGASPLPLVTARGGRRLTLEMHGMGGGDGGAERERSDARGGARADAVPGAEPLPADLSMDDGSDGEWLIVASEANDAALLEAMMAAFKLTAREAEVLHWVARGKTNRDIGDILGASPRTVTKHMAHILPKLGVETRTAAARMVLGRLGRLMGPARG